MAISWGPTVYDGSPPYSPSIGFPEYPFPDELNTCGLNCVYATVRESLRLLGLDAQHYDTNRWNPLGEILQPGDTVVLKPNLVREMRETLPGLDDCVTTHGSVIRAVLDYVYIAMGGKGRVIVADAPMDDADFDALIRITGLNEIRDFYRRHAGVEIEVYDLRLQRIHKIQGLIVGREDLAGDPAGYVVVDLGPHSAFVEIAHLCDRLYGASYDVAETRRHHCSGRHEYLVSKTVLSADCIIELPKLKTHQKVGLTGNLKLFVGICGNKDCVAHYRLGIPALGGDQFAAGGVRERLEYGALRAFKSTFHLLGPVRQVLARPLRRVGELAFGRTDSVVRSGNWYGNDTAWRMAHDLTRIVLYADAAGQLHDHPVRRVFSVVDGIVAGEGNGPLDATPKPGGLVLAGRDPLAIDLACARLMGFDYRRLPVLSRAMDDHALPLATFGFADVLGYSNDGRYHGPLDAVRGLGLGCKPHFGWVGHVELHDGR